MDSDKMEGVSTTLDANMNQGKTQVDWMPALGYRKEKDETENPGATADRIEFYNKHADSYTEDHDAMEYTGPIKAAEVAHKYLKGKVDTKILDVGCGTGTVLKELHKLAPYNNVHGLDPSAAMIERAQKEDPYQHCYTEFFRVGTGIAHNSYEAIVCAGAYIPGHLRAECFREMYDIVAPGGYIVNAMRGVLLEIDENFRQIRPIVEQMQREGKLEIVEDYMYPNYFASHDGHVYVLRKIK